MGLIYLFFIAFIKSAFEYYFVIIVIILCIEGAWALKYSRYKKILWFMVFVFVIIFISKAAYFSLSQTKDYNEFADYISNLDGNIAGNGATASMLALKTGKKIHLNQIDTNFQRRNIEYNFSNAIVVYRQGSYPKWLEKFNCSLLNVYKVAEWNYDIWDC